MKKKQFLADFLRLLVYKFNFLSFFKDSACNKISKLDILPPPTRISNLSYISYVKSEKKRYENRYFGYYW